MLFSQSWLTLVEDAYASASTINDDSIKKTVVTVPFAMPSTDEPILDEWVKVLKVAIKQVDQLSPSTFSKGALERIEIHYQKAGQSYPQIQSGVGIWTQLLRALFVKRNPSVLIPNFRYKKAAIDKDST